MAELTLWLVRHGLAVGGDGRCIGRTDLPLADEGRAQIRHLAATADRTPDVIWCSDRARAFESASLLADAWQREIVVDARLRELDFGAWDGVPWDELERTDGARLGQWMADWVQERPPEGESFLDLRARVAEWFAQLRQDRPEGLVAVVAHAGPIRALLGHLLDLPPASAFRFQVAHARVSAVALLPRGAELQSLNRFG